MMRVALKGLLGRKLRAALTAFAIVLGVAMISGSFVLTDTLSKSLDGVYKDSYKSTDAVVTSTEKVTKQDESTTTIPFSASLLREVESLPGVHVAQGSIEDKARLVGAGNKLIGDADSSIAFAADTSGDQSLNPLRVRSGQWPHGDGQIAIDAATARTHHLSVGDSIGAFAGGPVHHYRISGIVGFGSDETVAGSTIAVFDLPTAQRLLDKVGKLDIIRVGAKAGVSQAELVRQIRPLLSHSTQVRSGSGQAAADSKETQDGMSVFKYFLLGFGGIALFVGSFVIANTLAITVAQRMRELATLRTLGASRRQVLGSVVLESTAIGLFGSTVGLFLGLGIAKGLMEALAASGVNLPSASLVFEPRTIVVSLLAGTLVALLASLRPAIRATRVEPIAAVREGAVMPVSRFARYAPLASAVTSAVALGLFGYGMFASGLDIAVRIASLVAGVLLLFVGVAMIASRVVRPLAYVLGAPGARLGGVAGRLARQNAVRNPSRTASTAAAVMIGLALITFVAVLGEGLSSSFTSAVDKTFVGDYALTAGRAPLTNQAAHLLAQTPGVEDLSEIRSAEARVGGEKLTVTGVDGKLTRVVHLDWTQGSDASPRELGKDGAIVTQKYAKDHSLTIGSPLKVTTVTGKVVPLRVTAIYDEPKGGGALGTVSVSTASFDRTFPDHDNQLTLLNVTGGPSADTTARLEKAVAAFPSAQIETRAEFKKNRLGNLESALKMLYALLGLSIIVSLFGVINTLVLSVVERTRELGMLRAIGMTRRQVRRMVRHESIVTALIGATLGVAVGMLLAAITTVAVASYGVEVAVPYGTLVTFVGIAIVAGMLAAILPARRASRLNVLSALQYE
jgi:putative ABC transport system permease protein